MCPSGRRRNFQSGRSWTGRSCRCNPHSVRCPFLAKPRSRHRLAHWAKRFNNPIWKSVGCLGKAVQKDRFRRAWYNSGPAGLPEEAAQGPVQPVLGTFECSLRQTGQLAIQPTLHAERLLTLARHRARQVNLFHGKHPNRHIRNRMFPPYPSAQADHRTLSPCASWLMAGSGPWHVARETRELGSGRRPRAPATMPHPAFSSPHHGWRSCPCLQGLWRFSLHSRPRSTPSTPDCLGAFASPRLRRRGHDFRG